MKYQHDCPRGLDFCCKTNGKQYMFDTGLATTFINAYKTNEISICCPPWCHPMFVRQMHQNGPMPAGPETDTLVTHFE